MKLSKKTLLYSCILALIMVLLIIGYYILMLPALYVSYMEDSNYEEIVKVHDNYVNNGTYDTVSVKKAMNILSIKIPDGEECVELVNSYMNLSVEIRDDELKGIITDFKNRLENWDEDIGKMKEEEVKQYFRRIKDKLILEDVLPEDYPVEMQVSFNKGKSWKEQSLKVVDVSNNRFTIETSVTDGDNYYTAYIIVEKGKESLIISMLSVITPQMKEIRPIILQSLPMIIAVVFFLILILSRIFSNKIVAPIISLANYAGNLNLAGNEKAKPFAGDAVRQKRAGLKKRKNKKDSKEEEDEVALLGNKINELYEKLYSSYALLEEKNRVLEEDNKRQEVFLRASSHQLKTPIAAALLLVEGMMDEIGRYKNTKETLPKVKEQILSMRKIVEEILYLNHSTDDLQISETNLHFVVEEVVCVYQIHAQDKDIKIHIKGEPFPVWTNDGILNKIIDNLMSNAVNHTMNKQSINIIYEKPYLIIRNQGDNIPKDLLPHVFEPFVSSNTRQKGKGLGLYVVSWYCKLLHIKVEIRNVTDGVQVCLAFPDKNCISNVFANNSHRNFIENSNESDTI